MNIEDKVLTLNITVAEANTILQALGKAPYENSAQAIGLIHKQAGPQVEQYVALAEKEERNESKTATETSGS